VKINVIDLEATCWDTPSTTPSEIIQIGVSQVDTNKRTVTPPFSVIVKPMLSFTLSDFCEDLTGLTQVRVFSEGVFLEEAFRTLEEKFRLTRLPWASWGDYDRRMIFTEAERKYIRYPVNMQHLNVKLMFFVLTGQSCGMDTAMRVAGLELEGRHHDGGDDAYNISKLLLSMTPRKWVKQQ